LLPSEELGRFHALVQIIARLRGPDGCPWDREQTHASLREALLEECYEVLEALDEGSARRLGEELGDLLLQILMHAQIATEAGEFTLADVIRGISTKLIQRHPHVFGSTRARDSNEVLVNWEAHKREERAGELSMLDHVPGQLPALSYSQDVQGRVARVGFDWENVDGVIEKLVEEVNELNQAGTAEERAHEYGDLLFTLVNIARRMGVDSESALRQANRRFYRRFAHMEELCRQRGLTFSQMSFEQQNALWTEAKRATQ
jgi:tetrapyrrole methylase family protein/MazG family protein